MSLSGHGDAGAVPQAVLRASAEQVRHGSVHGPAGRSDRMAAAAIGGRRGKFAGERGGHEPHTAIAPNEGGCGTGVERALWESGRGAAGAGRGTATQGERSLVVPLGTSPGRTTGGVRVRVSDELSKTTDTPLSLMQPEHVIPDLKVLLPE